MFSFFKSEKTSKPLDGYLVRYLAGTYQMTPEETSPLHFVTTTESLASQKVTLFRIFDPSAMNGATGNQTYEGLNSQTSSLLFEGRFAKNKTVTEIRDMRSGE